MKITEKKLREIVLTFQNLVRDYFSVIYDSDAVNGKADMEAIAKTLYLFIADDIEETVRRHFKLASLLE